MRRGEYSLPLVVLDGGCRGERCLVPRNIPSFLSVVCIYKCMYIFQYIVCVKFMWMSVMSVYGKCVQQE